MGRGGFHSKFQGIAWNIQGLIISLLTENDF